MASYSETGEYLLAKLCTGFSLHSELSDYLEMQRFMLQGWGDEDVPDEVPYESLIGDDHSPFEYSVAFAGERVDLRLLFEVQAASPSPLANQEAALRFNERLALRYGVSLARFEAVRDLFLPEDPTNSRFTLWHGARFDGKAPDLKLYLNPQAFGAKRAFPIVSEALERLGLRSAVEIVDQILRSRGGKDSLNYFSLDLSDDASSRVKIYFRHAQANPFDVEKHFSLASSHKPGDVVEFTRAMLGHQGFLGGKSMTSCFAFTQGSSGPSAATCHLPIAHYAPDDATAVERSAEYLSKHGQPNAARNLLEAVKAFSPRPLDSGVGVQSYASYRRERSGIRFTAYLSPELFRESEEYQSKTQLRAPYHPPDSLGLAQLK